MCRNLNVRNNLRNYTLTPTPPQYGDSESDPTVEILDDSADDMTIPTSNLTSTRAPQSLPRNKYRNAMFNTGKIKIAADMAIADAGATSHFIVAGAPVLNKQPATSPLRIHLPDGDTLRSSHTCDLDVPALPAAARTAHIVPGLAHSSLVSIKVLCDAGCTVTYHGNHCFVKRDGRVIWMGHREPTTGLWVLPLRGDAKPPRSPAGAPMESANNVYQMTSKEALVKFLHQCLFSPPKLTLLKALENNQLPTWPLTKSAVAKYLPDHSPATDKGSMRRQRQGIRSTKPTVTKAALQRDVSNPEVAADCHPSLEVEEHNQLFATAFTIDPKTGTVYTDFTGKFPVRSLDGMVTVFILYDWTSNAILADPVENTKDDTIVRVFKQRVKYLLKRGFKPKFNIMDNVASKAVQRFLEENDIGLQLVEPHNHRVNVAERAIQTFKSLFIGGISICDPDFPTILWSRLIHQCQDACNLLRTSRVHPKVSAYHVLEGVHDFNKTPWAPPGTRATIFNPPELRTSWGPHALDAWYVEPARLHYRNWHFYVPSTGGFRTSGQANFYPRHCIVPVEKPFDEVRRLAGDLTRAVQRMSKEEVRQPCRHTEALKQLSSIFADKLDAPTDTTTTPAQSSATPTAPASLQATPRVHLRRTRANTPGVIPPTFTGPPHTNEGETSQETEGGKRQTTEGGVPRAAPPTTTPVGTEGGVPTQTPLVTRPRRKLRLVNGVTLGFRSNDVKNAKRKRVAKLVDEQLELDKAKPNTRQPSPPPRRSPRLNPQPEPVPPSPAPAPPPPPDPVVFEIPAMTGLPPPRCRSPHVISQEAVNYVTASIWGDESLTFVPRHMEPPPDDENTDLDIEQFCAPVVHPKTGEVITKYSKLANDPDPEIRHTWRNGLGKEFGNMAQGDDRTGTPGMNAIFVLTLDEIARIPKHKTVTYARLVVDFRPQKADPNRVRMTAGGNLISYAGELTTRTASITTAKLVWNSVVSTEGAKYACFDISNMYLHTPLAPEDYEYMRIPIAILPEHTIEQYQLRDKVKNGFIYVECRKCIYGLPQAGALANKLLKERLAPAGYYEVAHTPGLWRHVSRPVAFSLAVDDFGVKYVGKEHADHLAAAIERFYPLSKDWEGKLYLGMTLKWNYHERYVDVSMPGYVLRALQRYEHPMPAKPQHSPFPIPPKKFGAAAQEPDPPDTSPEVDDEQRTFVQRVVGSFMYYGRGVDTTIAPGLSTLASEQAKATEETVDRTKWLMDYLATHPNATIRYRASDMILNIHSDASYLSERGARSRAAGYYFLGWMPKDGEPIRLNGALHVLSTILRSITASAAEAELGALFLNMKEGRILRLALEELGHPQPPTPVHVDNATAVGIVNGTIKRQRSWSMEMQYFWECDEVEWGFPSNLAPRIREFV